MKRGIRGPILSISILVLVGTTLAGDGDLIVNGKVGVGTTAPDHKFTIWGEATGATIQESIYNPNAGSGQVAGLRFKTASGWNVMLRTNQDNAWLELTDAGGGWVHRWSGGDYYTLGRIGIGTTNPYRKLSISGQQPIASYTSDYNNVNTGSLFVQEFGAASGNTYTMLGALTAGGSQWGDLILQPGGNVGIGTTNPGYKLDVQGGSIRSYGDIVWNNGKSSLRADHGGSLELGDGLTIGQTPFIDFHYGNGASDDFNVRLHNNLNGRLTVVSAIPTTYTLYVQGSAYATGYWASSDVRFKKNIAPLGRSVPLIQALQPVTFNWRSDEFPDRKFSPDRQLGFIAQDIEQIIPEAVKTDDDGYKAISYEKLTAILVEAVKEQQQRIEKLEAQLEQMKTR